MTTIVVDQEMGFIAADRQSTSNDCDVACFYPKIRQFRIDGKYHLVASSGHEGPAQIFEEWYETGDWDEPPESMESLEGDDVFTSLILKPNSELWIADKFMRPYRWYDRRYATGSGAAFAWGALLAGVGIERAMRAALEADPNSGFGFEVVYLKDNGRVVERFEFEE